MGAELKPVSCLTSIRSTWSGGAATGRPGPAQGMRRRGKPQDSDFLGSSSLAGREGLCSNNTPVRGRAPAAAPNALRKARGSVSQCSPPEEERFKPAVMDERELKGWREQTNCGEKRACAGTQRLKFGSGHYSNLGLTSPKSSFAKWGKRKGQV